MTPDFARIAVVTVNYRTPDLALDCARALIAERELLPNLSLVLVDGGSGDGSADRIADGLADPAFSGWAEAMPLPINGGYGWANNQAILALLQAPEPPEFIYLLNPDAVIEPGAIARLIPHMRTQPRAAAVGSQIIDPDGSRAGSHFRFPTPRRELVRGARTGLVDKLLGTSGGGMPPADDLVECDWATGACVLLRSDALRDAGIFDDGFFLYFEEIELMWRMRAKGWTILHDPRSRVMHLGGASTGVTNEVARRNPPYWYASQRRFFALTQGKAAAASATVAWLFGHLLWRLRHLIDRREATGLPLAGRDRLRHGWPQATDARRSDTAWTRHRLSPPLWQENK
ncbi:hypothetical protein GGR88_001193 [Sphingomonas jejuensis]|uniref:Glycosyltransferase 2-like domain-containing protein n=1 Tax=Sphingomonas jejuensis TaxID=904715 RepID=A0ABX0XK53_9SPHN|nr:glycosyltransferase family 2 protein [Sphingomonas jejuensis]NJC33719.1 hypothetical protein [Sphingomonas jejuensis]